MEVKISGTIITYNESLNLARCIESMWSVCDEIVVVDSGSDDDTQRIALDRGARVVEQQFLGHVEQKNFAVAHAQHDVILSLDADEVLSKELSREISRVKQNFGADGYRFNRLNNYCGKWIRYGTWYPDRKLRLWNKARGKWGGENPHDRIILDPSATIRSLSGNLLHYTAKTPEDYLKQIDKFSEIQASNLFKKGIKPNFYHLHFKPIARFLTSYFLRLGFLDGRAGWQVAKSQWRLVRLRYAKLRSFNDMLNSTEDHVS